MKKLILSAACLLPLAVLAQDGYTIKGKIGTLNAPAKAYLMQRTASGQTTDSVEIKNGAFEFKGKVASPAQVQLVVKHDATTPKRGAGDGLIFYLENANISITAPDSVKHATIKGSVINDENAQLEAALKPANDKMAALMAEYRSKTPEERKDKAYMKTVEDRDDAITKEKEPIYKNFIDSHRNSYLGLVTFKNNVLGYDIDPKTAEPEFNKFSAALKSSELGKTIAASIESAKKTAVGVMAMDFTQNDVNDKPVKLSDFRGKFVLLDFWASWCGPCRGENPNVVAAYNKYKDQNFTVLGVSLDNPGKKDAWLDAIKADGLTWTQVSDLQGWKNAAANLYGVRAIPMNFLIDPTGKIIAKNVRGEKLNEKLAEVLGASK